jgi:hypothetical protein
VEVKKREKKRRKKGRVVRRGWRGRGGGRKEKKEKGKGTYFITLSPFFVNSVFKMLKPCTVFLHPGDKLFFYINTSKSARKQEESESVHIDVTRVEKYRWRRFNL